MGRHRRYRPFDYAMENIKLSGGVAIGSMIVEDINAQTGSHVDTAPAMNMLNMLPTVHASKGVLMGLQDMQNIVKKKRRHH